MVFKVNYTVPEPGLSSFIVHGSQWLDIYRPVQRVDLCWDRRHGATVAAVISPAAPPQQ